MTTPLEAFKQIADGDAYQSLMEDFDIVTRQRDIAVAALEEQKRFSLLVECWGRTNCEIYKHELKASADLSLSRIDAALDAIKREV